MRKLFFILIIFILFACSDPYKGDAKIVYHKYVPARNVWVHGYYIPGSCTGGMNGQPRTCSPGINIPGHDEWRPEKFTLRVEWTEEDGDVKRDTRSVPKSSYDECPDGRVINLESMLCPLR